MVMVVLHENKQMSDWWATSYALICPQRAVFHDSLRWKLVQARKLSNRWRARRTVVTYTGCWAADALVKSFPTNKYMNHSVLGFYYIFLHFAKKITDGCFNRVRYIKKDYTMIWFASGRWFRTMSKQKTLVKCDDIIDGHMRRHDTGSKHEEIYFLPYKTNTTLSTRYNNKYNLDFFPPLLY